MTNKEILPQKIITTTKEAIKKLRREN